MSIIRSEDGKKWINSFVAICALLVGFITIRFVEQLGEWFDLEAKVGSFLAITQGVGILLGLVTFVAVIKNKGAMEHMREVYSELTKVVWPDRDTVTKLTIGVIIGVSIISSIFVGIDFMFRKILSFIY